MKIDTLSTVNKIEYLIVSFITRESLKFGNNILNQFDSINNNNEISP